MSTKPLDRLRLIVLLALEFLFCTNHANARSTVVSSDDQLGVASWHSPRGRACRTASARRWVDSEMIAAHRTLPLGSKVRVINLVNGRSTIVEITDRGPYCHGRIIDVSRSAAVQLGFIQAGTARVRLERTSGTGR